MKKSLLSGLVILLLMISCKKNDQDVFFFKIGKDFEYKFSDIELYDTSTNILYFKSVRKEFMKFKNDTFAFYDEDDEIYSGVFYTDLGGSIPTGPYIYSPTNYRFVNYALRIENWYEAKSDIRKDPRMFSLLKQNNLFHPGLAISSSSIEITGSQLSFKFSIANHDQTDLLIIDPDKIGPNLFYYLTLHIRDLSFIQVFTSNFQVQIPSQWNFFEIDWFSILKSGESKQFTINYPITDPIRPGEYYATFKFSGPSYQVSIDQLYQGSGRFWLGDIQETKRITIR